MFVCTCMHACLPAWLSIYPSIYLSMYLCMNACMHVSLSLCVCVCMSVWLMHAWHVCTTPAHSWPKLVFRDRRALKMMQGKSQIRQSRNRWNLGTLTCKHWVFAITISAMAQNYLKLGYPALVLDRFLETQSWSIFLQFNHWAWRAITLKSDANEHNKDT